MPSQSKDRVRIVDKDNKEWTISEIPADLMVQFNERAKEMYPDKDAPWMHLILDTIASVCDVDKVTYQLTDIPADMMEQFEAKAKECEYTRFSIFSELLQAAGNGNFVVGRITTEESAPGKSIAMVMTGIPLKSWEFFQTLAEEAHEKSSAKLFGDKPPTAMALMCVFMQIASMKGFTFDWQEDAKPKQATPKRSTARDSGSKRGHFGRS